MRPNINLLIRRAFAVAVLIVATLGLTSCRKADHYFAIFGPILPGHSEPACGVFCVGTKSTVGQHGRFTVHRGERVRFINLTQDKVTVTLTFKYKENEEEKQFSLKTGKSHAIRVKKSLPEDLEKIEISYAVPNSPPQGGPNMIIEP